MQTLIEREARPPLERLLGAFPIAAVTGPRQSGKTTLYGLAQRLVVYDGDEEFEREGVRYLRPEGLAGEVRRAGLGG